jgi:outer membrane cobalamin receptor
MNKPHLTPLAGAVALALALPLVGTDSHAQPAAGPAQPDDEVVVLGRRLEESIPLDLQQFGNRVEIVSGEDLLLGGFNDVSQALQMQVPALYVAPKNGAFDYIGCSLQGSRCQDILWLVDGVRINNRLYNTTAPLDTIPAHMIERIEVLYGGQGIFYGTQSVAGVVNIVTKSFSQDPGGNVGMGFHGNGGSHLRADFSTTIGDGHQIVLYGSRDEADGFQAFRDEDYEPSALSRKRGYDVTAVGAKYAYAFSGDSQVTLHWHYSTNEVDFAAPSQRARSFNARDEHLITAKWDYSIGENIDIFLKGYFHEWDTRFSRFDTELDGGGQPTGNLITVSDKEFWGFKDFGLTAMARIRSASGLEYAFGYDGQRFSGRDDVLLIADRTEHVNGYFAQIRTGANMLGGNTRLAVGLRHNEPRGDGAITVGNFSARHQFSDRLYLRGGFGTSFRLPDAFQLYGIDECCAPGNPDLKGERSRNLDVALGGSIATQHGLGWEIGVFRREVRDLIAVVAGERVNSSNRVEFEGWEVNLTAGLSPTLQLTLNYTDTEATPRGSSLQIDDIPTRSAKANLRYRPVNSPWEFGAAASHVGSVWSSVPSGLGRQNNGRYTVVDLTGGVYFGRDERQRLGLRLENAFDEDYATSIRRAFRDADASPYAYWNLGTPRTAHLRYDYRF